MYKTYQCHKETYHLQRYKLFFELLMSVVFFLVIKTRLKPSCKISAYFVTLQIEKTPVA